MKAKAIASGVSVAKARFKLAMIPFTSRSSDVRSSQGLRPRGQRQPTPLLLRYEAGGYNCLHQDLYGEVAFPLQIAIFLSRRDVDYEGGEFLLVEQRPRAQSRGEAIATDQGEGVVFTTRYRPAQGARGAYRVSVRHGASTVRRGLRFTLGIIFHDGK
jgi:hypothetical protein